MITVLSAQDAEPEGAESGHVEHPWSRGAPLLLPDPVPLILINLLITILSTQTAEPDWAESGPV
jgi:hypothetical protein